jgi:hypothetical protein
MRLIAAFRLYKASGSPQFGPATVAMSMAHDSDIEVDPMWEDDDSTYESAGYILNS